MCSFGEQDKVADLSSHRAHSSPEVLTGTNNPGGSPGPSQRAGVGVRVRGAWVWNLEKPGSGQ